MLREGIVIALQIAREVAWTFRTPVQNRSSIAGRKTQYADGAP